MFESSISQFFNINFSAVSLLLELMRFSSNDFYFKFKDDVMRIEYERKEEETETQDGDGQVVEYGLRGNPND
jgi:hypothetical protein